MERLTEYDAIVIGSGACGLTAAVTLAEGGARVAVFEKQPAIGGTSVNFRGTFAVESGMQRQRYITYSRDEAFKNIMEYSHWLANPHLVRAIVDESSKTIPWLQELTSTHIFRGKRGGEGVKRQLNKEILDVT